MTFMKRFLKPEALSRAPRAASPVFIRPPCRASLTNFADLYCARTKILPCPQIASWISLARNHLRGARVYPTWEKIKVSGKEP